MRNFTLLVMTALTLAATAPASAQKGMMKDEMHPAAMTHATAADTRRMKSCNAMSHKQMMRSATCRRLAKMHPEMMHHGSTMQPAPPMANDNKM